VQAALNKSLNKIAQRGPMNPTVADWRTRNLLILRAPAVE